MTNATTIISKTCKDNGFTSSTPRNGYFLTAKALRRVKRAAASAGIPWQPIAARPSTAEEFCVAVEAEYPND